MARGWRVFFYSNEGNELPHIHAQKAGTECKYRLDYDLFEIREEYAYNMTSALRREVRQLVFTNLDLFMEEWRRFFGG
jgi:hypothetical protein